MQNFISFLIVLIFFENFEGEIYKGAFYHLFKMSLQGTIEPGRLRSELCPWGVKLTHIIYNLKNSARPCPRNVPEDMWKRFLAFEKFQQMKTKSQK